MIGLIFLAWILFVVLAIVGAPGYVLLLAAVGCLLATACA